MSASLDALVRHVGELRQVGAVHRARGFTFGRVAPIQVAIHLSEEVAEVAAELADPVPSRAAIRDELGDVLVAFLHLALVSDVALDRVADAALAKLARHFTIDPAECRRLVRAHGHTRRRRRDGP